MTELLSEVSPLPSYPSELDGFLRTVKDFLKGLPSSEKVKVKLILLFANSFQHYCPQLSEALSLLPDDVGYPLSFTPTDDIKGYFNFFPPKTVSVVGSFLVNTQLRNSQHVDLAVCMPEVKFIRL